NRLWCFMQRQWLPGGGGGIRRQYGGSENTRRTADQTAGAFSSHASDSGGRSWHADGKAHRGGITADRGLGLDQRTARATDSEAGVGRGVAAVLIRSAGPGRDYLSRLSR